MRLGDVLEFLLGGLHSARLVLESIDMEDDYVAFHRTNEWDRANATVVDAAKRLKLAGDLSEDLFRVAFTNLMKDLKYQLERSYSRKKELKISSAIRPDILSQRLFHALATGNWVGGRVGVSQLLDRTSFMSTLSHLRRVTSPLTRSQPHFEARDLHATQWGRLCPNETPEGQNCGLVKNYALKFSPNTWQLTLGVFLLLVIYFQPQGLWTLFTSWRTRPRWLRR